MKRILGLDLGTNSIGWALVHQNFEGKTGNIEGIGSRIIPMSQDVLDTFSGGKPLETQTALRTGYRGVRRLRERHLLRRERLHRVLNVLGFLPKHFASNIDFSKRLGQFLDGTEPKLAYEGKAFIFKKSFLGMVDDFKKTQPQLFYTKSDGKETKIPYDWTIYYLRKKALEKKIEKEELAWIILNFNQKRGYYQLRGEEVDENQKKIVEFHSLKIKEVVADDEPNSKGDLWYSLHLENGWIYRRSSKTSLADWKNKIRDFIVTTDLNDDGFVKLDKEGNEKRSFRSPKEDDWNLQKKKAEQDIINSEKTVGAYIYESLLSNPKQKIRGKLIRTIERKFYKEELKKILKKQIEFQPELFSDNLFNACVRELYRSNKKHQQELGKRDFVNLIVEDIIFYQRPLKSQKSTISNCTLEYRIHKDENGNEVKNYLKAIPKSNPLYQEFRVWQWMYNLKIYTRESDTDVTNQFLRTKDNWQKLFGFLMQQKEVNHIDILTYLLHPLLKEKYPNAKSRAFKIELDSEIKKYRWNYVFDDYQENEKDKSKKYPCNTTGYEIRKRLGKVENISSAFLTQEIEQHLWHIIYSVNDKEQFEKALGKFADKYSIDKGSFVENFKKFPPFESEYGSLSEKAIKKLLPLMRLGKYWSWEAINEETKDRIAKIITGEYDDKIGNKVREKAMSLSGENDFQGLQLWLAQYIVYNRHSESDIQGKWNSVADLEKYLEEFKQHSLRNPIVEQIITETLRVVRDIWQDFGNGAADYFDEIHVELGREMKNPADKRKHLTNQIIENENTNLRIKAMLVEMSNDTAVNNVRPYSPMQQEILKIYENGVLNSEIDIDDDILKISKKSVPTNSEINRYRFWLEQKYRSPYTGEIIPLSRLFTEDYQIEHIIPKSRYFDDSLNNKVICESAVNQLKDKQLGLEFIKNHHGEKVECGKGKVVEIFSETEYQEFVKRHYSKNKFKRQNLLLEDIPEKMIERQINDTRYISKFVSNLLSNIVRSKENDEGINSKNLVPINGKITSRLKRDWGLNAVWNELILPRFERMNALTKSQDFTTWNEKYQKFLPTVPLELSKNFQKKRIDHRHHAMDALVVACATRSHVNLLNNQSAKSEKSRYDLQHKLRKVEKWVDNNGKERFRFTEFIKPWQSFTSDAKNELQKVIISFKQNTRVINKAVNKYWAYKDEKGNPTEKKNLLTQKGTNWAIRKPLHKETVAGKVEINRLKIPKGKILSATRKPVDSSFNLKKIKSITDESIQTILINYLGSKDNSPELAFSPEGLEDLNRNIELYNNGKYHKPIYSVRIFELGSKFQLGEEGINKKKYVEAAKGTNLFFAIYWNEEKKKREFDTIPFNEVIAHQKQEAHLPKDKRTIIPIKAEKGEFLFFLSPNDLVYVPTEEEVERSQKLDLNDLKGKNMDVYKVVSFSGNQLFFIRQDIATSILNKKEFSTLNKMERAIDGRMIKENCIKIDVNRLGKIIKVLR